MLKKLVLLFVTVLTLCSSVRGEYTITPYPRFFKAAWLWAGTKKDVPMTACLRRSIHIDEPVRKAWIYAFWDKRGTFYFNGKKIHLGRWKHLPPTFGHVRGNGVDLTPLVKRGKNVLAVELSRFQRGCYGVILRGEIELASGRKILLTSSGKEFKASGKLEKDWRLPSFDDSKWPAAFEQGGPNLAPWANYGNVALLYSTPQEYNAYLKFLSAGYPAAQLARESKKLSARIVYKNHIPGVEINGKVYPPAIIPLRNDLSPGRDKFVSLAGKAGIRIFTLPVNMFEQSADYRAQVALSVRRLLAMEPRAYIIFDYREIVPQKWLKQNPDEAAGFAVKSKHTSYVRYDSNPFTQSLASDKFLKLMDNAIGDFAKFCLAQDWGHRVLGVKNGHGPSGDGMPAGAHCMPDTGKRMTEKFRAFLKKKYKTNAALQRAWGDKWHRPIRSV